MPIYEYRCQSCGHEHEALVRSGKEPSSCPACQTGELTRKISRAGVIFKGSGFYVTDSRGASSAAAGTKSSAPSTDSGSTGSSEAASSAPAGSSAPAAKTESSSSSSTPKASD